MAKAIFVKKAMKDYPEHNIKKGEGYWWWKFAYGKKQFSKTQPTRSQLTQSGFLGQLYDIEDRLGGINADSPEDLQSEVQDIISDLENLRDECESSRSAMPDHLQDVGSGELLQNRYDALDDFISELEGIDLEFEEPDEEELKKEIDWQEVEDDHDEFLLEKKQELMEEWLEEKIEEIQGMGIDCE